MGESRKIKLHGTGSDTEFRPWTPLLLTINLGARKVIKPRQQYPDWLYRALPLMYLFAGLLVMVSISNTMTFFSGLALILAGVMVCVFRYIYRRPFNASSGYINVPDWSQGDLPRDGHFQISWRSMFDKKSPVLAAKHRRLFGLGHELVNAVLLKKSNADVELMFNRFIDHMADYFHDQKVAMAQAKSPHYKLIRREHRALLKKAEELRRRLHENDLTARELLGFVTFDVIVEHLLKEELKFVTLGMKFNERRAVSRDSEPMELSAEPERGTSLSRA